MSLPPEIAKARREGMTGTDMADIAEGKLFRVFRRKEGHEEPDTPAMRRGRIFEAPTKELYCLETGAKPLGGGLVRHPTRNLFLGLLDDRVERDGEERVLEVKTAGQYAASQWGDGGDLIPGRYIVQVQHYLAITGLRRADVAALINSDLRVYTLDFDAELWGMLAEQAEKFWRDHIATGRPPPEDASEDCTEFLSERYPRSERPAIQASPEAEVWALKLMEARHEKKTAELRAIEAENHLRALIGDAEGVFGDGWRAGMTKGRKSTAWKSVVEEAAVSTSLIEKHTKTSPRIFRFTAKGMNDE